MLDNNNVASAGNEEDNSSVSSGNEEDVDSDTSTIKDNLKSKIINSAKAQNTMIEGLVPDFNSCQLHH